jgi:DNA-binding CsgD family transcriptional regulator
VTASAWERGEVAIERMGGDGLDLAEYRTASLRQVRSMLSVDAAFFATVDPATLLFTSAVAEEPLGAATPLFLDNEFGRDDVNKFAVLAGSVDPVASLDRATAGDRPASARYREVLAPLGLGDELRVALVSGGRCWGVLCLHREASVLGFDAAEVSLLRRLAPHLAEGLRRSVALSSPAPEGVLLEGPGIIILGTDLSLISINEQAERWLAALADPQWSADLDLPLSIYAAAAHLAVGDRADRVAAAGEVGPDTTRLRRAGGGWITVHASPLRGTDGDQIALVLDAANASQLSSLVLAAHGLTPAQTRVASLVLQGWSTRAIVAELHISSNTMQEHLRAVFDKFGIGSRRELVAALSGRPA